MIICDEGGLVPNNMRRTFFMWKEVNPGANQYDDVLSVEGLHRRTGVDRTKLDSTRNRVKN